MHSSDGDTGPTPFTNGQLLTNAQALVPIQERRAVAGMDTAVDRAITVPRQSDRDRRYDDSPSLGQSQVSTSATDLDLFDVTVIVPTRNECDNIVPLVERLTSALAGTRARVLFVDDSDDDTPAEVSRVAATSKVSVSLYHRDGENRSGGLGGAVLAGLRQTTSPWAVVMDGDLQHPPELVPELLATGQRDGADVVVASRHVPGGSSAGLSSVSRVLVSDLSITLSKVIFPKQLRGISDPMSGFFALKPASFDLESLRPKGFKILLELLARSREVGKTEMPFAFGERQAGESKASLREGFIFVWQLIRLRLARMISGGGRSRVLHRGAGFAAVGVTGMFVNIAVMWALADPAALGVNYLVAAALATQASSSWNFALIDRLVYRGPKRLTATTRWLGFMAMSNLVLLLRIPVLWFLVSTLHIHYLPATVATLLLGFALRFKSQERLTLTEEIS